MDAITAPPATTSTRPQAEDDGAMIGRTISATLSPESRRRSNIFGILHSDAAGVDAGSPHQFGSPSSRSHPARMDLDSLVHQEVDQGIIGAEVMQDGVQGAVSPSTFRTLEDRLINDMTRQRSASPSKEQIDRRHSVQSNGIVPEPQPAEEGGLPSSFDQGVVEMEIDSERQDQDSEFDEQADEQPEHDQHDDGDVPSGNLLSSGEEDEGQIDGAIDAEADPEAEEEEDDEEDSESDDSDDEGSIDLDQEDAGDSPVFISMRNGPLGISDLLLPPAAGDGEIRVKAEPGQEDLVQSQAASSDPVVQGSRAPSQEQTSADAGGAMDVISIEDNSQHASINGIVSTENQPSAVAGPSGVDPNVNVLVAKPKKKRVRAKSPSPPPAPPPKPRVTIRVAFNLFDEEEGPDGKGITPRTIDGVNERGLSTISDVNGDVSKSSTPRNETEALPSTDRPSTPKAADPPAPREEPKFRVVNFKQASIAQGKVDSDYYVVNSGWNAMETDDDDEEADDMEVDGVPDKAKARRRKFGDLLANGTSGSTSAIPTPGGNGGGDSSTASGILQAMMGGADEAELARLAEELDQKYNAPTTLKPRRKRVVEDRNDYDYQDPFIDDSDLKLDEPMTSHRPAKEGFYVQNGTVELINDEEDGAAKKAKVKKQTTLNFGKISVKETPPDSDAQLGEQPKKRKKVMVGLGYRPPKLGTPVQSVSARHTLGQSDSGKTTSHRSAAASTLRDSNSTQSKANGIAKQSSPEVAVIADPSSGVVGPPPPLARPIGPPFTMEEALARLPEEIRPVLIDLSNLSQMSDIEWKKIKDAKKFPETFRPLVYAVGKKAVELGLVGDALYDALPFLIPYNRFTMKKYILDKLQDYQAEHFQKLKQELLSVLRAAIINTVEPQVVDYNAQLETYQISIKNEQDSARQEGRDVAESFRTQTIQNPVKRIRWSDGMRQTFWHLVKAVDNDSRFEAQQAEVHNRPSPSSAVLSRSQLYAEIVPLFPEGWMSSQQLSRQLSSLKMKHERQGGP